MWRPRVPVAGSGIQWLIQAGVKVWPMMPVSSISRVSTMVGMVSG